MAGEVPSPLPAAAAAALLSSPVPSVSLAAASPSSSMATAAGNSRLAFHPAPDDAETPYPLPADLKESDRLRVQHEAIKHAFSGRIFHTPQHALFEAAGATILDVGCGPGIWTREFATTFPNCQVIGIDMNTTFFGFIDMPENVKLVHHNVFEKLPFPDNTFDLVFQRALAMAVPKAMMTGLVQELKRVTKPGGYIQLVEPYMKVIRCGPLAKKIINWGGIVGSHFALNFRELYKVLKSEVLSRRDITSEEYDQLVEDSMTEYATYKTYGNWFYAFGQVPG
ncbi:hypothetical protein HK405_013489 [Cladochytrium tenue]|nr:hypothetical protein HK405_013489 [Cladochytrium tenue]